MCVQASPHAHTYIHTHACAHARTSREDGDAARVANGCDVSFAGIGWGGDGTYDGC